MTSDILIVDDEADIRDLVAGILDDEGHTTETAANSDEALATIAAGRPSFPVAKKTASPLRKRAMCDATALASAGEPQRRTSAR